MQLICGMLNQFKCSIIIIKYKLENPTTWVCTIPIRWDLNIATVFAISTADISPASILWIALWMVQYVPVLPIPALSERVYFRQICMWSTVMIAIKWINKEGVKSTCSAPLLGQGLVVNGIIFSKFHAQQMYLSELHGQAIQDTEYAKQIMVHLHPVTISTEGMN